jgi:hypothetical protein
MPETREMRETHDSFAFVDAGRTFTCRVEPLRPAAAEAWWWFRVSSEVRARFAPFRAAPSDTPDVVRGRILEYYDDLLARRAAPVTMGWGRRRTAAAPPAAPLVPAAS